VSRLSVSLFVVGMCTSPAALGEGLYVGGGAGTVFTQGLAAQVAVSVRGPIELQYSGWHESGQGNRAFSVDYRFSNEGPLSVVLGAAYVRIVDDNLLRHPNAYVEVRYRLSRNWSCQASHYSGPGPDRGENMFLCGIQWSWRSAAR
jgi:hypothetical protein